MQVWRQQEYRGMPQVEAGSPVSRGGKQDETAEQDDRLCEEM